MWFVRCGYRLVDGSITYEYKYCVSHDWAVHYARCRRSCLNSNWTVEVCDLEIASAQVVEK